MTVDLPTGGHSNRALIGAWRKGYRAALAGEPLVCPYEDKRRAEWRNSVTFSRAFRTAWISGWRAGAALAGDLPDGGYSSKAMIGAYRKGFKAGLTGDGRLTCPYKSTSSKAWEVQIWKGYSRAFYNAWHNGYDAAEVYRANSLRAENRR